METKSGNVKISACIITYNHENYLKDCLEGALKQKVNGTYEIIISEDRSTDRTREIALEYQKKYPEKIKLFLNENNLGLIGNWVKSMQRCNGQYIAICEGDDYWTDENKLQKQVDFLDNNPEFSITSHNADVLRDDKVIRKYCVESHPEIMNLEYLLEFGSGGPTCSLVFRNDAIKNLPEWFSQMHSCDWTVQVICAQYGKMKYFKENMGIWRKHGSGAAFNANLKAQTENRSAFALPAKYSLEMNEAVNKHFDYKFNKIIRLQNTYWYNFYLNEYLKIGNRKTARKYALKILYILFPFNYWKYSWMNKNRFYKLVLLIFPFFIEKIIRSIYNLK